MYNQVSYSIEESRSKLISGVYSRMTIGLLMTAVTAFLLAATGLTPTLLAGFGVWGFIIAEFALVWYISARIQKLQTSTAIGLFFLYAVLNGVTLSAIFYRYELSGIATAFFITGGMFASMAIYGQTTKRDLSSMGSILFMGVIGLCIASLVNFFLQSDTLGYIVSFIGVIIFSALTMYDAQRIRYAADDMTRSSKDERSKVATLLGLSMYLNFINLFMFVLRFVGGSRD